jgi:hypothetical protein
MGEFIWNWLHLPPLAGETALHIDLASALIALLALGFSIYTWWHQGRMRRLAIIAQRDAGLILWIELAIDVIVGTEFFLRSWTAGANTAKYVADRDQHLAQLAAVIDKGRLYFPWFTRDIELPDEPAEQAQSSDNEMPAAGALPLLDDLVEIYDLIKALDFLHPDVLKRTRIDVMRKKRHFVAEAQKKVEFRREPGFIE